MILDEKYKITGMSCAACSSRIDKVVRNLKGVKEVNVNLLTNSMVVSYDEKIVKSSTIIKTVEKAGYGAELLIKDNKGPSITKDELKDISTPKLLRRLIVSFVLLVPLFYLSMGYMLDWPIGELKNNLYALVIIEFVLSLIIILINNKFFISGTKALLHLSPNMDSLVMIGSGVSFIYSVVMGSILISNTINGDSLESLNMIMMNISFETAGMVPTLITIGKTLESYSKGKTTNAIKDLMDLSPKTATILVNEEEKEVSVEEIKIGTLFVIKPGENIPVDGEIVKGNGSIDESMLTGESMPIDKSIGDIVKSGTTSINGVLICKAIRVGKDTTLNQIIDAVEKAANSKAKISKIADRVSSIFVPAVILASIIVFICWISFGKEFLLNHSDIKSSLLSYSFERAIAILVISCPCALGLATPVAIMVGSGKSARNGILFKNAESIEETGKVDYVILDKTGTITEGKPSVSKVISYIDENELLSIALTLENGSSHPLAEAIKHYCSGNKISGKTAMDYMTINGRGITAKIGKEAYFAGNLAYFKEKSSANLDYVTYERLSKEGSTPLLFFTKDKLLGIIAVSDKIKEDSGKAISLIKNLGIVPVMLTGDNELVAKHIAEQVGLDIVISGVLPEGKLDIINEFKKHGKVMMVGDGINDAIALTSADIGVAIGSGSDVAINSGSIVLMKSTLMDLYAGIRLSSYTYLNIKENLFWAFIYNIIMIPIAAGAFSMVGLYRVLPWMGSAAMAASSVFVVLNALRINLFNPYKKRTKQKKIIIPEFINNYEVCLTKGGKLMEKTIKIEGMMCMHCVAHVKDALTRVKGVDEVEVSLDKGTATIKSKKEIKEKLLIQAVEKAGYKVVQ